MRFLEYTGFVLAVLVWLRHSTMSIVVYFYPVYSCSTFIREREVGKQCRTGWTYSAEERNRESWL